MNYITPVLGLILGLLICFGGYKLQKLAITIIWFIIGYSLANTIGSYFISDATILFAIKIIFGLFLGSLGYKLEKLAIFIAIAYIAYNFIGTYIVGSSELTIFAIRLGISLVIGAVAIMFIKESLIVATGIFGANIIVTYLPTLLASIITLSSSVIFVFLIIFAVVGILVQFKTN